MCGRFEQHLERMQGWTQLLDDWPADAADRFDIRPTQVAGTIDASGFRPRRWSLIPPWSDTERPKYATFNAKAETLTGKPAFRNAWRQGQRCVVPASAYYEWSGPKGRRQCHRIHRRRLGFAFAGLWERWKGPDATIDNFTIITVAAAPVLDAVHHRMPLMLAPDDVRTWLHGPADEAQQLMVSHLPDTPSIDDVDAPATGPAIGSPRPGKD